MKFLIALIPWSLILATVIRYLGKGQTERVNGCEECSDDTRWEMRGFCGVECECACHYKLGA